MPRLFSRPQFLRHAAAFLLVSVFVFASASLSEALEISWADLPDASVQSFEDPYRDLTYDQLYALRKIARLRDGLKKPNVDDEERARIELGLSRALKNWEKADVDPYWLIDQRWIVAERRKRAGTAGNPELDGKEARLTGFVIPAPSDAEGRATAYLVPERGMCSHMPPPQPNQLLRLVFDEAWYPQFLYEPITVSGRLEIAPTQHTIRVVDGLVKMVSTFRLNVARVAPLMPQVGSEEHQMPWPRRPHWQSPEKEANRP